MNERVQHQEKREGEGSRHLGNIPRRYPQTLIVICVGVFMGAYIKGSPPGESDITSAPEGIPSVFRKIDSVGPPKVRPTVRHRESIPDSHLLWMPEVLEGGNRGFPAAYHYESSSMDRGAAAKSFNALSEAVLPTMGAILVRGLPVASPQDFSQFMAQTGLKLVDYIGGVTSRPAVAPRITPTSTEPSHVSMEPHVDNPYWPKPPTHLVLYAQTPAAEGGQSILTDARGVLRQLQRDEPGILAQLKERRVRYNHFYPDRSSQSGGNVITSWQEALAADCSGSCNATIKAEANLRQGGFSFEWTPGGLRKWELSDAVKPHPVSGEESWANMITAMHCSVFDNHLDYRALNRAPSLRGVPCKMRGLMPYDTSFGDGGHFPVEMVTAIRKAQWNHSVSFDYEPGDVLLIDNYLAMHGRFSWRPEIKREIFMAMVQQG